MDVDKDFLFRLKRGDYQKDGDITLAIRVIVEDAYNRGLRDGMRRANEQLADRLADLLNGD